MKMTEGATVTEATRVLQKSPLCHRKLRNVVIGREVREDPERHTLTSIPRCSPPPEHAWCTVMKPAAY